MTVFWHLFRIYARRGLLALLAAVMLLGVGDFAELASSILGRADALAVTLLLYQAKFPTLLLQAMPLAILFGVLLGLAELQSNHELLALRAAGASDLRLALPAITLALIFGLVGGSLGGRLAPEGMRKAVSLQTRTLGRWTWTWTLFHKPRSFFLGREGEIYQVEEVQDAGRSLNGVTRYEFHDGRLADLYQSEKIEFVDGAWVSELGQHWRFAANGSATHKASRDQAEEILSDASVGPPLYELAALPLALRPEHFGGVLGQPDELSDAELAAALLAQKVAGRKTIALELERSDRGARPLFTLAVTLLALGLALRIRTPRSSVGAASLGIGVAFLSWILLAVFRALGLAALLSPAMAAFLPPLILGGTGALLLLPFYGLSEPRQHSA